MGTLDQSTLNNNPATKQDLKVTFQHSTLVFPIQHTEKKSMFLPSIDQILNFDVQMIHFFGANPDYPIEVVNEKLKSALSKVLAHYDFLAGRLKVNKELGRLEIDCNGAGVGFVLAKSELSLNDIGDLVYPNPGFAQLIVPSLDNLEPHDHPLCIVQVTSFKCGAFALGTSTNHVTFDGISFKHFLKNLASQAFDEEKPLAIAPCNDRNLLAPRSPPRVTFPHPELLKLNIPPGQDMTTLAQVFEIPQEELDCQLFQLSSTNLSHLKECAKSPNPDRAGVKISSFNAVTAHIWRCKALSRSNATPLDNSMMLYAVDIRPRLNPPLPESYTGNAVLTAYANAKCKELEEGPFYKIVEMVSEGVERISDEYVRSAIDWSEVYKGFPHAEFMVSSWWRLGFAEVEYPWGKPKYSCPVVNQRKDIILLLPDIDGVSNNNGVNVLVSLPHIEMEKFQTLFHKFLQ